MVKTGPLFKDIKGREGKETEVKPRESLWEVCAVSSARRLRSSGSSPDRSQEPPVGWSCASGAQQR